MRQGYVLESVFGRDIQGRKNGEKPGSQEPSPETCFKSLRFLRGCHCVENRRDTWLPGKDW